LLTENLDLDKELSASGIKILDPYRDPALRHNIWDSANFSFGLRALLRKKLVEKFKSRPAHYWETFLNDVGVPCTQVRNTSEWKQLAEVHEAGLIEAINDPELGKVILPGAFVCVGTKKESLLLRSRVLSKEQPLWSSRPPIAVPSKPANPGTLPLAGTRVLDLSTMIAGPLCARTLCELGADVIKIDSPQPLHGPRMTAWYGMDVSHGKRSILLNLKLPEGRSVFGRLADESDVVVHNFSNIAANNLGIDQCKNMIVCGISAFKGSRPGSWDLRKGYDPVLQAATGVSARYGSESLPQLHGIASCVDCLTGYLSAFGILCSLYQRHNTQNIGAVSVSLAQGVQFIQHSFFTPITSANDGKIFGAGNNYFVTSSRLRENGIDAAPVFSFEDEPARFEMEKYPDHPCGSELIRVSPTYLKSRSWRLASGEPFPKLGSDTASILTQAGYALQIQDQLQKDGVISSTVSDKYLPG